MTHLKSRAIEAMAGKQVGDWLRKEEMLARIEGERPHHFAPLPLIVFSRLKASGGTAMAETIASELGYDLLDRAFLNHIAERAEVSQEVVALVDERIRKSIFSWMEDMKWTGKLSNDAYFVHLTQTVASISKLGQAVLVGRGANFIVKPEEAFRVRVYCPLDIRIERLARSQNISAKEAHAIIKKTDHERREFVERWFHKSPDDADSYDMSLNTHFYDVEGAAKVIVNAYLEKFHLTLDKVRERLKQRQVPR